ncbi:unnamed protein product [Danaus chrysippus]|uniref:(African queen) hypothetical protein n=1 Tax=Danaus chrysippus TaxID=151541 RepID=A0A8J2QP36_9NEOP|nr:unnamed protein product [Danaus chrysippus]
MSDRLLAVTCSVYSRTYGCHVSHSSSSAASPNAKGRVVSPESSSTHRALRWQPPPNVLFYLTAVLRRLYRQFDTQTSRALFKYSKCGKHVHYKQIKSVTASTRGEADSSEVDAERIMHMNMSRDGSDTQRKDTRHPKNGV